MTSPGLESPVTSWKLAGQAKEYPPLAFLLWLEVYKGPDFPCPTPALCPSPLTARDTVIHLSGGCGSTLLPEPLLHPEGHLLGSPGPGAHHGLGPAVVVTQASFLAASIPQAGRVPRRVCILSAQQGAQLEVGAEGPLRG